MASDHRRLIRDAFAYRIGGPSGTDDESIARDLHAIRQLIDAEAGDRIDWYLPPYIHQWSKHKDLGQRAWLVRPRQGGSELVERWWVEGFVSLDARHLGEVTPGSDLPEVRAAVEAGYEHEDYAQRLALAHEYHAFLTRMKTDDVIATISGDDLRVGVITGEPEYSGGDDIRLCRGVVSLPRSCLPRQRPLAVLSLLDQQGTVVDITASLEALTAYLPTTAGPRQAPGPSPVDSLPRLPAVSDALVASTCMSLAGLQEIADVLQSRQPIVLYGPPGTGKTYLARKLAEHAWW